MPIRFLVLGGGGFVEGRVGWKCQFYFYGHGDFSEFETHGKLRVMSCGTSHSP